MAGLDLEWEFRERAFAFLRAVQLRTGGPVRQADVGFFEFRGGKYRLMPTQQGILKPRQLDAALSFVTRYSGSGYRPYDDHEGPDGLLRYKWEGTDPDHYRNRGMRLAMEARLPLIYFRAIAKGLYEPIFPVTLVGEEVAARQFVVALDEVSAGYWDNRNVIDLATRRVYAERATKVRVHQPVFRSVVLDAYGHRCALCNLRRRELLDAAHIRADADGGEPVVTNGISMCKIHHAAYDSDILGIRPDRVIRLRSDVLMEQDGPTLRYSLQGLHGEQMQVPRRRAAYPSVDLLEERWDRFKQSA